MATNQQNSTQWDLGRFVKTLSYFGAVPWLSNLAWFQHWFGSRPNPKVDASTLVYQPTVQDPSVQDTNSQALNSLSSEPSNSGFSNSGFSNSGFSNSGTMSTQTHRPIFDFTTPSITIQEIWGALDDVVMGGVSQSTIQMGESTACFSGIVSTANSGGFASVRTRNIEPPLDLSAFDGVELRVKGDGNRYKFMLRTEDRWDGIAYCYSFNTVPNEWITVQIPFNALIPVFRAKTVNHAAFAPSRVCAMQLMLSKFEYDGGLNPHFQPGAFQLQVESIQAYAANS